MKQHPRQIKLRGITLTIPDHLHPETASRVLSELEARLTDIESKSTRIDTQAFALQTALSFALDAAEARKDHDSDTREILLALDKISDQLRTLLDNIQDTD